MIRSFFFKILYKLIEGASNKDKSALFHVLRNGHTKNTQDYLRCKYNLHKKFRFNGDDILMYGEGQIICGANTYIGNYSTMQAYQNCKVKIGKNCSISHNVRIYTMSNISDQDFNVEGEKIKKKADVIIEDGVWIGANVLINPGSIIGQNSVIGANSVVSGIIEPNSVYGGVPAKLIKKKTRI